MDDVELFCNKMYPPTEAPTDGPSISPSTKAPTKQPTIAPQTQTPKILTTEPTKAPTVVNSVERIRPNGNAEGSDMRGLGYAIAGGLLFFLGMYFSRHGRRNKKKALYYVSDESSYDQVVENSSLELSRNVKLMGMQGIEEDEDEDVEEEDSHGNHADVIQFDPNSSVSNTTFSFPAIQNSGAFLSTSDSSSNDDFHSVYDEDDLKTQLDAAMDAGDWNAVAALAADINVVDSDEEDSMVSNSQLSQQQNLGYEIGSFRQHHSMEYAQRAAKIDKLIAQEDWDGISLTAASFGYELDVIDTDVSSEESDNVQNVRDRLYLPTEQVQTNTAASVTSSLSNASPTRNINILDFETDNRYGGAALGDDQISEITSDNLGGTNIETFATMPLPSSNSSSGSDNEKKPILSTNATKSDTNDGQRSRSWIAKALFRKAIKEKPSELALQEDSSGASSWTHSSDEENAMLDPYGNGEKNCKGPMQTEIEAFGTGYGLAAAESVFHDDYRSDDSVNKTTSVQSKDSLRDELDRAIETGDWTAVERQTSQMLDQMLDTSHEEASHVNTDTFSSTLSDRDTSSNEEWSSAEGGDSDISFSSSTVDDENIEILEGLIKNDDWQGIVTANPIYNQNEDSTTASSVVDFSTTSDYHDVSEKMSDLISQDEIWNSIAKRAS